jgi:acetolactate synthase-1/2/3 large subunit
VSLPAQAAGGHLIARWIKEKGITHFFTLPGESFLPVLDGLRDLTSVRTVTVRHEAAASYAAESFAKLTQRPAVCMVTRGPGASNLLIGVHTAFYDGTPLIALVGMVPRSAQRSHAFQDFDLPMMFGSIAKRASMIDDAGSILRELDRAYEEALDGRPGPVVLGIPTDVLYGPAPAFTPTASTPRVARSEADSAATTILDLLMKAERPALLVATEAIRGGTAASLAEFSTRAGLPVYAAWRRYSSFDNGHPHFVGSLGLGASQVVSSSLADADLVVTFGFGLEQITIQSGGLDRAGATLVQVAVQEDADVRRRATRARVFQLRAAPADVASRLAQWCVSHADDAATLYERLVERTRTLSSAAKPEVPPARPGGAHLDLLMHRLNAILPHDAIVTSDAGNFAHWLLRYINFDRDRTYLGPLNGSMGYALPAAIGAELAMPGRPCWSIAGDGGMLMLAGEMETAVRLGLQTTALVINNMSYGTIRAKQETEYPGRVAGTDLGEVDFASMGRAFGWQTWKITTDAQIEAALGEASRATGCRLIEAVVEQPPFGLS